jgi:hypothetical protein
MRLGCSGQEIQWNEEIPFANTIDFVCISSDKMVFLLPRVRGLHVFPADSSFAPTPLPIPKDDWTLALPLLAAVVACLGTACASVWAIFSKCNARSICICMFVCVADNDVASAVRAVVVMFFCVVFQRWLTCSSDWDDDQPEMNAESWLLQCKLLFNHFRKSDKVFT